MTFGRKLLFSGVMLAGTLALLEVAARFAPADLTMPKERLMRTMVPEGQLVPSFEVPGWDLDLGDGLQNDLPYHANQWRMRGPDYPEQKTANDYRVVMLGDSSVFGVQLTWEQTWTANFEALREKAAPSTDYQVGNCASPGHSTIQSKLKLEHHCLPFDPDVVVICNQFSDSTYEVVADLDRFVLPKHPGLDRAVDQLYITRILRTLSWRRTNYNPRDPVNIAQIGQTQPGRTPRVPPDEYGDNLRIMVDMVRDAGATPVLFVLAAQSDVVEGGQIPSADYRTTMAAVAAEMDVLLVDAPAFYRRNLVGHDVFADHVHPNAAGARWYAHLLHKSLPGPGGQTE